jgi:hypothetical protein
MVRKELEALFAASAPLFLEILQRVGFPVGDLKTSHEPKVLFGSFLDVCRGLSSGTLAMTFGALSQDRPGSAVLAKVAAVTAEYHAAKGQSAKSVRGAPAVQG